MRSWLKELHRGRSTLVLFEFLSMCSEKTRERSTSSSGVVDALLERLHTLLRLMVGKEFSTGRLADRVQDILPIYLLHFWTKQYSTSRQHQRDCASFG